MLPAISDFIKGALSPDLLKALQPAGVVSATVFLLLNVLLIFPDLVQRGVPFAIALLGLGTVWQAAVATALVLLMAYLLVSLNSRLQALFTGETWRDSPVLGPLMLARQERHRRLLVEERERKLPGYDQSRVDFNLITRFSTRQGELMPTGLGNVLNALTEDLYVRWGIDFTAAWPRMEAVLAADTALAARISNERATLDFLVNLAFVLVLFSIEHLILRFSWGEGPLAVLSVGFWIIAWLVYTAAIGKARAWADVVGVAFDLYRDKLRDQLGMPETKGRGAQILAWEALSRWILFRLAPDDLLSKWIVPAATIAEATPSANVTVRFEHVLGDNERQPRVGEAAEGVVWSRTIAYLLVVQNPSGESATASGSAGDADGVFVTAIDMRIPTIATAPTALARDWAGEPAPVAEVIATGMARPSHQVLWKIARIAPRGARLVRYSLPMYTMTVTCSAGLVSASEVVTASASGAAMPVSQYRFTLRNSTASELPNATIVVKDTRLPDVVRVAWGAVLVMLVVERKDSDGRVMQAESGAYSASLLDVDDAQGARLEPPYAHPAQVRISLPPTFDGAGLPTTQNWQRFAEHLAGASAIYVWAAPPTATPGISSRGLTSSSSSSDSL